MRILSANRSNWNESKAKKIAGVLAMGDVIVAEIKTKKGLKSIQDYFKKHNLKVED